MNKLILTFIAALLIGLSSCTKDNYNYEPIPTSGIVKYVVISNPPGFDITYENKTGGTSQLFINTDKWEMTFTGYKDNFVYISAQADNENAKITVEIFYRGNLIKSSTSEGDYVIATASRTL